MVYFTPNYAIIDVSSIQTKHKMTFAKPGILHLIM